MHEYCRINNDRIYHYLNALNPNIYCQTHCFNSIYWKQNGESDSVAIDIVIVWALMESHLHQHLLPFAINIILLVGFFFLCFFFASVLSSHSLLRYCLWCWLDSYWLLVLFYVDFSHSVPFKIMRYAQRYFVEVFDACGSVTVFSPENENIQNNNQ